MSTIAILRPIPCSREAARQSMPEAIIKEYNTLNTLEQAFKNGDVEYLLLPVYNTREGQIKEHRDLVQKMNCGSWRDNIVLPVSLSLATLDAEQIEEIDTVIGTESSFRQCQEFLAEKMPTVTKMMVNDPASLLREIPAEDLHRYGLIESEEFIHDHALHLLIREVVPHNKTRFALIGHKQSPVSGYDATTLITRPLRDRVGLLSDILAEFTRRGISIIDIQSETDIKTQKLGIYLEVEGHITTPNLQNALNALEQKVIQEERVFQLLGSFPRVDMRVKNIKSFGFIGSGAMSKWFTDRLANEGYETMLTGRSSKLPPHEMIAMVDVVAICVPISATAATIEQYGPLLRDGQALIILAGESERNIATALSSCCAGVEILFVHNLWGPQAASMKDKNVNIVRTARSGNFCDEFEAFLYKHGAKIHHDSDTKHDLLMGLGQKLPTAISIALAMTLGDHQIKDEDINSHSTLTSIYGILAMARIHNQNPRTYAEILATKGEGWKIVESFIDNLAAISKLGSHEDIDKLTAIMDESSISMGDEFLQTKMRQAKAVDEVLSNPSFSS